MTDSMASINGHNYLEASEDINRRGNQPAPMIPFNFSTTGTEGNNDIAFIPQTPKQSSISTIGCTTTAI
jgi:hypothetical protein